MGKEKGHEPEKKTVEGLQGSQPHLLRSPVEMGFQKIGNTEHLRILLGIKRIWGRTKAIKSW